MSVQDVQDLMVALAASDALQRGPQEMLETAALAACTESPNLQAIEYRLRRLAAKQFLQQLEDLLGQPEPVCYLEWNVRAHRVQVLIAANGDVIYTIDGCQMHVPKPSLHDLQDIVDRVRAML
mgnify:CR=1 FL=1